MIFRRNFIWGRGEFLVTNLLVMVNFFTLTSFRARFRKKKTSGYDFEMGKFSNGLVSLLTQFWAKFVCKIVGFSLRIESADWLMWQNLHFIELELPTIYCV